MTGDTPGKGPADLSVHSLYKAGSSRRLALIAGFPFLLALQLFSLQGLGRSLLHPEDTFCRNTQSVVRSVQIPAYIFHAAEMYDAIPVKIPALLIPGRMIVVGSGLPRRRLASLPGSHCLCRGSDARDSEKPLVSPFTLGLSSAASFGAAVAIVIGPAILGGLVAIGSNEFIVVMAFVFGWLSMLLVYGISRARGVNQATLILSGVVIGYIFSAGLTFLQYITNNEKLRDLVVWLMGGMWGASWSSVLLLIPLTIIPFFLLERMAWDLNAMSAGDDVAKNLGINVNRLRLSGLMISTFAASCCLAFTGIIGFIGLMGPHICRMIIGNDHRYLIPCAGLMGAAILLISDTVARTIMSPVEIPVGVIMYVLGGVFFLFLIMRARGRGLY